MPGVYADTCVVINAFKGRDPNVQTQCERLLADTRAGLLYSDFHRLELLPKPLREEAQQEIEFIHYFPLTGNPGRLGNQNGRQQGCRVGPRIRSQAARRTASCSRDNRSGGSLCDYGGIDESDTACAGNQSRNLCRLIDGITIATHTISTHPHKTRRYAGFVQPLRRAIAASAIRPQGRSF